MTSLGTSRRADPASWLRSTHFAETSTLGRSLGSDLVLLGTSHRPVSIEAIRSIQALQWTAGHNSVLGLQARRCPAATELERSAAEGASVLRVERSKVSDRKSVV